MFENRNFGKKNFATYALNTHYVLSCVPGVGHSKGDASQKTWEEICANH
ncbi:unnamed protein product [Gulo gulo]|uniref:Uncharacterized protein n=1 Tax=Gulo gulo TaxID=48420 RepID=A0A9X9LEJ6_GULGU|nr:unnamed protein product [Gulo gulo]